MKASYGVWLRPPRPRPDLLLVSAPNAWQFVVLIALNGGDNVENRVSMSIAAVETLRGTTPAEILKRRNMGRSQVMDVNVVADTASIGGRIVDAEDFEVGP